MHRGAENTRQEVVRILTTQPLHPSTSRKNVEEDCKWYLPVSMQYLKNVFFEKKSMMWLATYAILPDARALTNCLDLDITYMMLLNTVLKLH